MKTFSHHQLHIFLAFLFCILILLFLFWPGEGHARFGTVTFADQTTITVEIAQTPESREQGLSGRTALKEGEGMLFLFDEPQIISLWMKDMLFFIDMLWIKDDVIMAIEESVPVPAQNTSFLPQYTFEEPVPMVLEVPAGFVEKHGLEVGQEVKVEK